MKWLLLISLGLMILNFSHIFYINIYTHSLPFGLYMKKNGIPQKEDYAATCLNKEIVQYGIDRRYLATGGCDTGTVLVLKKIKGLPGDGFEIKNGFLELNGHSYYIMKFDSSGRELKSFYKMNEGFLNKGEYILLSDFVRNSWDSRYWGPVRVQFLLKPLFLFEQYR